MLANKNKDSHVGQSKCESQQVLVRHKTQVQSQTVTTHPPGPLRVQSHISEIETLQRVQTRTHFTQTHLSLTKVPNKCSNIKLLEKPIFKSKIQLFGLLDPSKWKKKY